MRLRELEASAAVLGVKEVTCLGYDDSGMDGLAGRPGRAFARVEVEQAAKILAEELTRRSADVLTVYDPAGGYGHPDHVQVHRVGIRAAQLAGTPIVLQATTDRRRLMAALRILRWVGLRPGGWDDARLEGCFADPSTLTHSVDVRAFAGLKRQALASHRSQASSDETRRLASFLLSLPSPVFAWAFGREWFADPARKPGASLCGDVFAGLGGGA